MNETVPCCKNCRYSYGSGERIYCGKHDMYAYDYGGCLMYEEKEIKCDENLGENK